MRLYHSIVIVLFLLFSACAGPQPAPSWDLSYTPTARPAIFHDTRLILLLKPVFMGLQQVSDNEDEEPGPADTIAQAYNTGYCLRLQEALQTDLEKIFKIRGMATAVLQSDSIEQIRDLDKRKADLVVATSFSFGPQVNNTQKISRFFGGEKIVTNTGTIQFIGTVTIEFLDPRSNGKVLTKMVNIASLGANTAVDYENQIEAENRFKDLLHRIYPQIMGKIEKKITAEELQTALKKVR